MRVDDSRAAACFGKVMLRKRQIALHDFSYRRLLRLNGLLRNLAPHCRAADIISDNYQ